MRKFCSQTIMATKWGWCCIRVWLHNVAWTFNCVSKFQSNVHSNTWLTQFYKRCGEAYLWTFKHTICI